jgi:hypothetical protein
VLNGLYCSPKIIRDIKSRRKRWARHVVHMTDKREEQSDLLGKYEGRSNLEDLDVDGRIISRWIFRKCG